MSRPASLACIETDQDGQGSALMLRRVPEDGGFARNMGTGNVVAQRKPAKRLSVLSVERHEPKTQIVPAVAGVKHHLVMVAQDRDQAAVLGQRDQLVEHSFGVEAAIDLITQSNDRVVRRRALQRGARAR